MSDDDEIYGAPTNNEIDFFKIKNRFEHQAQQETKPQVRPKPVLRESFIQNRILNAHTKAPPQTIQGRGSVESCYPPDPAQLPPKSAPKKPGGGAVTNSPFLASQSKAEDDSKPPALVAKKSRGNNTAPVTEAKVGSVNSNDNHQLPPKLTPSIKKNETPKGKEEAKRVTIEEKCDTGKGTPRKSTHEGKENVLPAGLKVGMIRKGADGKSYKLLPLPANPGPPPPKPPIPEETDLSPYFMDDDLYDDVEDIIPEKKSFKRGSMRPISAVSEILPMTEEEEEEMDRKTKAKKPMKPDSQIYDDTLEGEDEELYDDIANTQEEPDVYEDI